MSLSIGIVGLPNVGKSTLFETITKKQVEKANYPFTTIDPAVGVVAVPDERIDKLADLSRSRRRIYSTIEFVDIAGLVKGANKGEGLGNKFLANIRETDAVLYVLRIFKNDKIVNVQEKIHPLADKEILDTELLLKDLETISKRADTLKKDLKGNDKVAQAEYNIIEKVKALLEKGNILGEQEFEKKELQVLHQYQLLTMKPRLFLLNGNDEDVSSEIKNEFQKNNWHYLIANILDEFGSADLTKEERASFGLPEDSELDVLIKKAYEILGLITFFTTGEDETRAWTLEKGEKAPSAGGVIHSDFEERFIRADVIHYQELLDSAGYAKAREKGLTRTEGKDYVVQDGDVIEIRHDA